MNTFGINFIKTELNPMLKATIKNIFHTGEQAISIIDEKEIECAIDKEIVGCTEMNNSTPWVGIPAPAYLEDDEWFGPAPIRTQKQEEFIQHQEATERLQTFSGFRQVNVSMASLHMRHKRLSLKLLQALRLTNCNLKFLLTFFIKKI